MTVNGRTKLYAFIRSECNKLIKSVEQSASREANSRLASQRSFVFYGNRRYIIVFTRARHWSVQSQVTQSSPRPHALSYSHVHQGLTPVLYLPGLPIKFLHAFLISTMRAVCPAHNMFLYLTTLIIFGEAYKLCSLLQPPISHHFLPLRSKYSPPHPVLRHHQSCVHPLVW